MSLDSTPGKTRKRASHKPSAHKEEAKTKLTLYVPSDLARRFAVHATYTDTDRSALFAEMIREYCKRFVVSDRQTKTVDDPIEEPPA